MLIKSTNQQIYFIKKYIFSVILILIFNIGNAQETKSSLGTLKQINAGVLNIGYTEAGLPHRNSSNFTSRMAV